MSALLWLVLVGCAFSISFGVVRLASEIRAYRLNRRRAAYRAAVMVVDEYRRHRAGQHRAAESEWGRAA